MNIPIITSVMAPGISTHNGQRYAQPGWIPIDNDITLDMLRANHINPYAHIHKGVEPISLKIQGTSKIYTVTRDAKGDWDCQCPGWNFRKKCKHVDEAKTLANDKN